VAEYMCRIFWWGDLSEMTTWKAEMQNGRQY